MIFNSDEHPYICSVTRSDTLLTTMAESDLPVLPDRIYRWPSNSPRPNTIDYDSVRVHHENTNTERTSAEWSQLVFAELKQSLPASSVDQLDVTVGHNMADSADLRTIWKGYSKVRLEWGKYVPLIDERVAKRVFKVWVDTDVADQYDAAVLLVQRSSTDINTRHLEQARAQLLTSMFQMIPNYIVRQRRSPTVSIYPPVRRQFLSYIPSGEFELRRWVGANSPIRYPTHISQVLDVVASIRHVPAAPASSSSQAAIPSLGPFRTSSSRSNTNTNNRPNNRPKHGQDVIVIDDDDNDDNDDNDSNTSKSGIGDIGREEKRTGSGKKVSSEFDDSWWDMKPIVPATASSSLSSSLSRKRSRTRSRSRIRSSPPPPSAPPSRPHTPSSSSKRSRTDYHNRSYSRNRSQSRSRSHPSSHSNTSHSNKSGSDDDEVIILDYPQSSLRRTSASVSASLLAPPPVIAVSVPSSQSTASVNRAINNDAIAAERMMLLYDPTPPIEEVTPPTEYEHDDDNDNDNDKKIVTLVPNTPPQPPHHRVRSLVTEVNDLVLFDAEHQLDGPTSTRWLDKSVLNTIQQWLSIVLQIQKPLSDFDEWKRVVLNTTVVNSITGETFTMPIVSDNTSAEQIIRQSLISFAQFSAAFRPTVPNDGRRWLNHASSDLLFRLPNYSRTPHGVAIFPPITYTRTDMQNLLRRQQRADQRLRGQSSSSSPFDYSPISDDDDDNNGDVTSSSSAWSRKYYQKMEWFAQTPEMTRIMMMTNSTTLNSLTEQQLRAAKEYVLLVRYGTYVPRGKTMTARQWTALAYESNTTAISDFNPAVLVDEAHPYNTKSIPFDVYISTWVKPLLSLGSNSGASSSSSSANVSYGESKREREREPEQLPSKPRICAFTTTHSAYILHPDAWPIPLVYSPYTVQSVTIRTVLEGLVSEKRTLTLERRSDASSSLYPPHPWHICPSSVAAYPLFHPTLERSDNKLSEVLYPADPIVMENGKQDDALAHALTISPNVLQLRIANGSPILHSDLPSTAKLLGVASSSSGTTVTILPPIIQMSDNGLWVSSTSSPVIVPNSPGAMVLPSQRVVDTSPVWYLVYRPRSPPNPNYGLLAFHFAAGPFYIPQPPPASATTTAVAERKSNDVDKAVITSLPTQELVFDWIKTILTKQSSQQQQQQTLLNVEWSVLEINGIGLIQSAT